MQCDRDAILVTYPVKHVIKEAASLADAAGYEIQMIVTQKHLTTSKFGVGRGKAEELKNFAKNTQCDAIIIDEVIKPTQQYNLASLCGIEVVDRERLILDIFERRASTAESKIQIKLAKLRYEMIRAREKVRLAKAGEQPGFFGMGKYDADVYYLDIRRRAAALKAKLLKEESRREIHRTQRFKSRLKTISIAGYTSAGKTSLFNILTGESKTVGKGLFTTLSTFTRAIALGNNKVLFSDTVGFVSKLPPYMIDAFKSTLNELVYSALVLLILDASEPETDMKRKLASSIRILSELNVPMSRVIFVFNKIDLVSADELDVKLQGLRRDQPNSYAVCLSAKTSVNIGDLKSLINELLYPSIVNLDFQN